MQVESFSSSASISSSQIKAWTPSLISKDRRNSPSKHHHGTLKIVSLPSSMCHQRILVWARDSGHQGDNILLGMLVWVCQRGSRPFHRRLSIPSALHTRHTRPRRHKCRLNRSGSSPVHLLNQLMHQRLRLTPLTKHKQTPR